MSDKEKEFKGIIIERGYRGGDSKNITVEGKLRGELSHPHTVPVTLGFDDKKIIGKARPYIEDNVIKADLLLDEGQIFDGKYTGVFEHLTPAVKGKLDKKEGDIIRKFYLLGVGLCVSPNLDPYIGSLGEQTEVKPLQRR